MGGRSKYFDKFVRPAAYDGGGGPAQAQGGGRPKFCHAGDQTNACVSEQMWYNVAVGLTERPVHRHLWRDLL